MVGEDNLIGSLQDLVTTILETGDRALAAPPSHLGPHDRGVSAANQAGADVQQAASAGHTASPRR